ncbi:MAG: SDR family oxidoreductase [Vicinamibacterales bacterium]
MRIVITGALGHIGSRLIHGLQPGEFDEVALFDNLSTQRYCSLFALPKSVPFRFIEGDVRTAAFDTILDDATIVVHLAAVTNAALSLDDEARMESVNFEGTARVAEACARAGCRLFLPSTTSVYGVMSGTVDEDCPITGLQPQNPYAATKLRAEQMLQALAVSDGLRYVVGRFGTIYDTSVGMRFHTAINKFCWQASLAEPLSVWRTAMDQSRPYLDLDDAVRAIQFMIERDLFDNRVYNVISQNATVREVVALIREVVPGVEVELVDSPIMNDHSYAVSAERFRRQGFEFRGDLRSGIRRTLALLSGLRQGQMPHDRP